MAETPEEFLLAASTGSASASCEEGLGHAWGLSAEAAGSESGPGTMTRPFLVAGENKHAQIWI